MINFSNICYILKLEYNLNSINIIKKSGLFDISQKKENFSF